jgi:hypothetical protein
LDRSADVLQNKERTKEEMSQKKISEGFTTGQATVLQVALQIAPANAGRENITLVNTSAVACWIGGPGVTVGTGLLLAGVVGATLVLPTTAALFGITGSSATISYMDCA